MSSSLWPCGLQYTRFPCPSLSPGVCSNSHPLSWWCYPAISSCNPLLLLPSVFPSIFPKTYWWPTDTWKDAQHHSSLEKCKSKPQWDITSYLLEWLSQKRKQITIKKKRTQKKKTNVRMWRIFVGNVNWCSPCGKQYSVSSKKPKNRVTTWPCNSTFVYLFKENKNTNSKRCLHPNVHSSFIYDSQDMEAM